MTCSSRGASLAWILLLLGACQHPQSRSAGELIGGYFLDRGRDLTDIVALDAGIGGWLGARVHVGEVAHVGLGYETADRYGWYFGRWLAGRAERHLYPPVCFFDTGGSGADVPALHNGARRVAPSDVEGDAAFHECYFLFPFLNDYDTRRIETESWLWGLDVEAAVQIPLLGVRVGVSPGELLDFVAGIFGIDLAADDTLSRPPSP